MPYIARLEYAALYAAVNILILVVLSYLVVRARQTHKIALGHGDNRYAERAIRAHGNAAEYIPVGLIGLVVLALLEAAPVWLFHAAGLSLTIGRLLHGFGLHTGTLNFGRLAGMALTYASLLLLAGGLFYAGLAGGL